MNRSNIKPEYLKAMNDAWDLTEEEYPMHKACENIAKERNLNADALYELFLCDKYGALPDKEMELLWTK